MTKTSVFLLSVLLVVFVSSYPAEASDSFSSYLVGTADLRDSNYTVMQIINPTALKLRLIVGFFSPSGVPQGCRKAQLPPNGMVHLVFRTTDEDLKPLVGSAAVVKIVSYLDMGESGTRIEVAEGIVGFQRHYFQSGTGILRSQKISESNLAAIPQKVLTDHNNDELNKIKGICNP